MDLPLPSNPVAMNTLLNIKSTAAHTRKSTNRHPERSGPKYLKNDATYLDTHPAFARSGGMISLKGAPKMEFEIRWLDPEDGD
jgi:hypothetical protein